MSDQGHVVDMVQDVLHCYQAMEQGRPRPPPQTRQKPVQDELKILNSTWSGLQGDTKRAWSNETNENKENIIAQCVANSKSSGPVKKNHNLRTVYKFEFEDGDGDGDGYYSDCTADFEVTHSFDVNSVMFNTTTDDSNWESIVEGGDFNDVNAAAAKKQQPSILRNRKNKILKASEMPAGAVSKMMTSKQMKMMTPECDSVAAYLTFSGNMANIDYSRCDTLVPIAEPVKESHYKVNLLHSHKIVYKANLSIWDRVIGGKTLHLLTVEQMV